VRQNRAAVMVAMMAVMRLGGSQRGRREKKGEA
jgi:hypothetical protein